MHKEDTHRSTNIHWLMLGFIPTLLTLAGCATDMGWKTARNDTPWIAPGVQATERTHSYMGYMAAGVSSQSYWGTEKRRGIDRDKVLASFEEYIQESGWLAEWQVTGSSIGKVRQRLAPYLFTIVSINPAIVIATPLEIPPINKYWEVKGISDRPALQKIYCDYMITPLEFGTTVAATTNLTFVNLATRVRQDVKTSQDSDHFTYATRGCRLELVRTNSIWQVTRLPIE